MFNLAGPTRAYVVRMDRSNPNVTLDTSLASGHLIDGKETVSQMAERYDGSLGSWEPTWGGRNQVVAAINGSFHDPETGRPLSGMVQSGWYIKRFNDLGGGSGFAWRLDRSAFIGGCVTHPESAQLVTYLNTGVQQQISRVDEKRQGGLTVYTPMYDVRTHTPTTAWRLWSSSNSPLRSSPIRRWSAALCAAIHDGQGDTSIPFDSVVLSASGGAGKILLDNVEIGSQVGLSTYIQHFKANCRTPDGHSWSETYASLSGSFPFLLDGEVQSFSDTGATTRSPRTAVCFNDDFVDFVVVDGRNEGVSVGMTINELAHFCQDRLDADWGINQDGGGSSTLWLDGKVVNNPSDGHERAVANGVMMIEVKPPEFSDAYQPGDVVQSDSCSTFAWARVTTIAADPTCPKAPKSPSFIISTGWTACGRRATTGGRWPYNGELGWVPESAISLVARGVPPHRPATAKSSLCRHRIRSTSLLS